MSTPLFHDPALGIRPLAWPWSWPCPGPRHEPTAKPKPMPTNPRPHRPENGTCVPCNPERNAMTDFSRKAPILVTCPRGLPDYLQAELTELGFPDSQPLDAGVQVHGTLNDCMRLNLWVRTGHRVLFGLKQFRALDADELYREAKAIPWEEYIADDGYFRVDAAIRDTTVNDSRFAGLRDQGRRSRQVHGTDQGKRPDSGPDTTGVMPVPALAGKPGLPVPRHHGRAPAPARLPQTAAQGPHAGDPGRGLHPGRGVARDWPNRADTSSHPCAGLAPWPSRPRSWP